MEYSRSVLLSNCDEGLIFDISNPVETSAFIKCDRKELLEK